MQTGCGKYEVQFLKFFTKVFLRDSKLKMHESELSVLFETYH